MRNFIATLMIIVAVPLLIYALYHWILGTAPKVPDEQEKEAIKHNNYYPYKVDESEF